jgi:hypothetical protein
VRKLRLEAGENLQIFVNGCKFRLKKSDLLKSLFLKIHASAPRHALLATRVHFWTGAMDLDQINATTGNALGVVRRLAD